MNDLTEADAAQVRRMVPRIRRMLAEAPGGATRAALRRRLNSREKHLYDAALSLLVAVGDVMAVPVQPHGTRYLLTDAARKTQPERPSRLETEEAER